MRLRMIVPLALLGLGLLIGPGITRAAESPPVIPGYVMDFMDDFQDGINESYDWWCEHVGADMWCATTDGPNGIARCTGTQMLGDNRCTDMLTLNWAYRDFVVMWDMRFGDSGWHQDRRLIYFRSTNGAWPHGYWVQLGVKTPLSEYPPPTDWVVIAWDDGLITQPLTPKLEHAWNLNQWYTFKLQVQGSDIKLRIWPKGTVEPAAWFVQTTDPDNRFTSGRFGFGNYWLGDTDVDNVYLYVLSPTPTTMTSWSRIKALASIP